MYQYVASLIRVIDGDTVVLDVDLGFAIHTHIHFRLASINAPEVKGETRDAGLASKAALEAMLAEAAPSSVKAGKPIIYVDSTGQDKYGRWVAKLSFVSGKDGSIVDVSERLIAEGFAARHAY